MTWKECPKHADVFYDSSDNTMCPACARDILKTTVIKWALLDLSDHELVGAILEWISLSLDAILASTQMKKEATSKSDSALERVKELREGVIKGREELMRFIVENDLRSIFRRSENQI